VLPPLIRILQLKKLNRALGESRLPSQVLKLLHHPEAVVRKGVLQVLGTARRKIAQGYPFELPKFSALTRASNVGR